MRDTSAFSSAQVRRARDLVLAAEDERLAAVRAAQQVLREIERRIGQEPRAGHLAVRRRPAVRPCPRSRRRSPRPGSRTGRDARPSRRAGRGSRSSRVPWRRLTSAMKACTWLAAARSADGIHSGVSLIACPSSFAGLSPAYLRRALESPESPRNRPRKGHRPTQYCASDPHRYSSAAPPPKPDNSPRARGHRHQACWTSRCKPARRLAWRCC